ncbi:hypothetical protein APHCR_1343 [Anaplasma phagocytophilum str. CR1007]|nr:hypothetical protein APHCR_1343 [Anaplasma phagocytophilum str. CR1007]
MLQPLKVIRKSFVRLDVEKPHKSRQFALDDVLEVFCVKHVSFL